MKYEVAPAEKSTVKITMRFTAEEWNAALTKAYLETRGRYAVNGFRKGKAPRYMIESFYGKGVFFEDALNGLYRENYGTVLEAEKEKFRPVAEPELALGDDFSEENVVLVATTPIFPEVKIEKYTGIKIPKYEYTVTDADVDARIERYRAQHAKSREVTDRPAQNGDTVKIDFVGKVDGKAFEGGTAAGYDLTLGSGSFIPGFEEGVVGMTIGEVRDINVTFPEDYQSEELKGKAAVFTVTLHAITERVLPEANDEFAKLCKFETMDRMREYLRGQLENSAANRSRDETENSILTEIAKTATAELPDALIEMQQEESLSRFEQNFLRQGVRPEDYYAYVGSTREEYKKNFEEEARRTVMNQCVLETLLDLLKIEATEEEISARIAEQAASVGKEPETYKKGMDPRQIDYITADIKIKKLFEYLEANNEMVKPEEAQA